MGVNSLPKTVTRPTASRLRFEPVSQTRPISRLTGFRQGLLRLSPAR